MGTAQPMSAGEGLDLAGVIAGREGEEISVPFQPDVFLGVSAGNFHNADLAFWRLRDALDRLDRKPTRDEGAALEHLRAMRKRAYLDLVEWVATTEAQRLGAVQ